VRPWEVVMWVGETMLECAEWRDEPQGDEVEATMHELWTRHFGIHREHELIELLRCGVSTVMLGNNPLIVSYELREVGTNQF
jgi:hypothetical protein